LHWVTDDCAWQFIAQADAESSLGQCAACMFEQILPQLADDPPLSLDELQAPPMIAKTPATTQTAVVLLLMVLAPPTACRIE
jgi:hypothetical protein